MKIFVIVISIIFLLFPLIGNSEVIRLIDVPTASTLLKGYYDVNFIAYGNGGIQTRLGLGLTDRIMLGIIEDIGGAIGTQNADWKIPGVFAKVNIIYPDADSTGLAVGYDTLLNGEYGKVYNNQMTDDLVYGFYVAATRQVSLFKGEQFLHFGLRFPILPYAAREGGKNISCYSALNIIVNPELMFIGEVENIYFSGDKGSDILYNAGIKYAISDAFTIGLTFQYTASREINPLDKASRSLYIEYQNIFY